MRKYILKRLGMTIFVVLATAVMIFTIMYFVPGDPVKILLGADATPEQVLARRTELGLEDPFFIQLGNFMFDCFVRFDLGTSWTKNIPVVEGLTERLPRTLMIGLCSVVLSTSIAIPLGIMAAIHRNGWQDRVCTVAAMICISIPDFWISLMMVIWFSLELKLLPSMGIGSVKCYIMPVVAASLHGIGTLTRQTRSSMLEVIHSDFVTTARAKGLKERKVIYQHILPNALIPVITTIGQSLGRCIAGTIIIEQIFSIPGVGTFLTEAISGRDYPVIRGCTIILAIFTALMMLLVDLAYAVVDPRIRAQYESMPAKKRGGKKSVR